MRLTLKKSTKCPTDHSKVYIPTEQIPKWERWSSSSSLQNQVKAVIDREQMVIKREQSMRAAQGALRIRARELDRRAAALADEQATLNLASNILQADAATLNATVEEIDQREASVSRRETAADEAGLGDGDGGFAFQKCCICYEHDARVAFGPCGHLACCEEHATGLDRCPICRVTIGARLKIFAAGH